LKLFYSTFDSYLDSFFFSFFLYIKFIHAYTEMGYVYRIFKYSRFWSIESDTHNCILNAALPFTSLPYFRWLPQSDHRPRSSGPLSSFIVAKFVRAEVMYYGRSLTIFVELLDFREKRSTTTCRLAS